MAAQVVNNAHRMKLRQPRRLGMAVVLAGIGLLIVHARRLIERRPSIAGLRRITAPLQLVTASVVVVLGIVLTSQALTQVL